MQHLFHIQADRVARSNARQSTKTWLFVLAAIALLLMPFQVASAHSLDANDAPEGPATLIKDINTATVSSVLSDAAGVVAIGELTYFVADDGIHGAELWKTDRTAAGTTLVRDITPGPTGSYIRLGLAFNNILYFGANNGVNGWELWKTDGTEAGTILVKDINPGPADSLPGSFVVVNGVLFFTANDGVSGNELWRSDGSEAGTVRVTNITAGPIIAGTGFDMSFPLTYMNGRFFFVVNGSLAGDVWTSDGTVTGTSLLKDIYQGSLSQFGPSNPVVMNNTLYFVVDDGVHGYEVWRSDGTTAGTWMVKDVNPSASGFAVESEQNQPQLGGPIGSPAHPRELTAVNGTLYFSWSDGNSGYELWKSDGTANGTMRVKDIAQGADSSLPELFTPYRGGLIFSANGGLWKTDGSEAGTILIASLNASAIRSLRDIAFVAADNGRALWITDGTASGTHLIKCFDSDSSVGSMLNLLVDANGVLFFFANDVAHGYEPWMSNGTAGGTVLIKDINTMTADASPQSLTDVNGQLFFTATDSQRRLWLWKSDGSAFGTQPIKKVSSLSNPVALQDMLCFVSSGELWKSDGSEQGTFQIKPESSVYLPTNAAMFAVGNLLFFAGVSGNPNHIGLWKSDSTPEGTTLVKDFDPNSSHDVSLFYFANAGGTLFFVVKSPSGDDQLWKSDGTEGGTVLLKSLALGSRGIYQLTGVGGTLFFATGNSDDSGTLWKSDGTESGTVPVKNLGSGAENSFVREAISVNGRLYFRTPHALWTSDGTADGTMQVLNPSLPTEPLKVNVFASLGDSLIFATHDGEHDELWMTNGTGAVKVKMIGDNVAGNNTDVTQMTNAAGSLMLLVNQTSYGSSVFQRSLWVSDGTDAGTYKVQDLPSYASSPYPLLTVSGGAAYFTPYDPVVGIELWRAPNPHAVDTFAHANTWSPALPGGVGGILIDYGNKGGVLATGLVITAMLHPALTYQSDTSGISPIIQGNTVSWVVPDLALSNGRQFYLQVVMPDAPLGTQYPVKLTFTSQGTDVSARDNTATATLKLARMTYLPATPR